MRRLTKFRPVDRWKYISFGFLLLFVGISALLYATDAVSVPMYDARASVSFERQADYDLICRSNSFLYSTNILFPVCKSLDLPLKWGIKYSRYANTIEFRNYEETMELSDCSEILSGKIYIETIGPHEAEIISFSSDSSEAVQFANATAWSCADWFNHWQDHPPGKVMVQVKNATHANNEILSQIQREWKAWGLGLSSIVLGTFWIRWGRKLPRSILVPQIPETDPISKY
jgi:hypothetical protein